MQCYMNGRHRKAELDRNKRRDLDHKQEIGSGVEISVIRKIRKWHDMTNDVRVGSVNGLHPSLSTKT